jgi:hypothetical protein
MVAKELEVFGTQLWDDPAAAIRSSHVAAAIRPRGIPEYVVTTCTDNLMTGATISS